MATNRLRRLAAGATPASGARLMSHLRIPLYRNGYLLTVNGVTTSALGLVYWALAARIYSAGVIGLNSAAISAMLLLSGIAQLGLSGAIVRFAPLAGRATRRMVTYAYGINLIAAVVVTFIFSLGLGVWAPALAFISRYTPMLVSFVLATMTWCIFVLQDSVLTGLRRTWVVPIENTSYAVMKIVLLAVFARILPRYGIFASWTLPVVVTLIPINAAIFRRFLPIHARKALQGGTIVTPRHVVTYVAGNYFGSLFALASTTLLPIIVADRAGARAAAYFYLPWIVLTSLQLVTLNMATSLTVEAARDEAMLSLYCYRILQQTARLLVPLVAIFLLGAPYVLHIFGAKFATEGAWLLRLLALSTLPNIVVMLYITIARVQNRAGGIVVVQAALCFLVLGMSTVLLPFFGISGVGIAYLTSQTVVALLLAGTRLRPRLRAMAAAHVRGAAGRTVATMPGIMGGPDAMFE